MTTKYIVRVYIYVYIDANIVCLPYACLHKLFFDGKVLGQLLRAAALWLCFSGARIAQGTSS